MHNKRTILLSPSDEKKQWPRNLITYKHPSFQVYQNSCTCFEQGLELALKNGKKMPCKNKPDRGGGDWSWEELTLPRQARALLMNRIHTGMWCRGIKILVACRGPGYYSIEVRDFLFFGVSCPLAHTHTQSFKKWNVCGGWGARACMEGHRIQDTLASYKVFFFFF